MTARARLWAGLWIGLAARAQIQTFHRARARDKYTHRRISGVSPRAYVK